MKNVFLILSVLLLAACHTSETSTAGRMVGADRDGHGCLGSAGYVWSNALHDCIRVWESGVRLERGPHSLYIVFSTDSLFCEIMEDSIPENRLCKRVKGTRVWHNRITDEQVIVQGKCICATTLRGKYFYSPSVLEGKQEEEEK